MSLDDTPVAVMWTMLVELQGRRVSISWPSLALEEEHARYEAENAFKCKILEVRGSENLCVQE